VAGVGEPEYFKLLVLLVLFVGGYPDIAVGHKLFFAP